MSSELLIGLCIGCALAWMVLDEPTAEEVQASDKVSCYLQHLGVRESVEVNDNDYLLYLTDFYGVMIPQEFGYRIRLRPNVSLNTIAHESYHIYQHMSGERYLNGVSYWEQPMERNARQWADANEWRCR